MAFCAELNQSENAGEEVKFMEGTVMCDGLKMDLSLTSHHLKFRYQEETAKRKSAKTSPCVLNWCDVITAESTTQKNVTRLVISYIEKQKKKELCIKELSVTCPGGDEQKWVSVIKEQCEKVPGRPKKVLVVINPIGGNGKGEKTYQKRVAPILEKAGIEAKVFVTERSKHGLEIGETFDFTGIEGVLIVGGDGILQEVVQGYVTQLQKKAGIELCRDNFDKYVKPEIPFCLIPSGSSNGMTRYTNDGVIDTVTSTLRVVTGEVHHLNILAVYERDKFMSICCLGCVTGFMVDFMRSVDEKRWMGKNRYLYGFVTMMLKKRRFCDMKLEFLTTQKELTSTNQETVTQDIDDAEKNPEWVTFDIKGKQYASAALMSCGIDDTGSSTCIDFTTKLCTAFIDTGMTNMEIIKSNQIWFGKKLKNPIPNFHLLKNLKGMRFKILRDENETDENVTGTRAKNREEEHYVFMDGEILRSETLEIEARLLSNFLPLFSCLPTRPLRQ